MTTPAGSGGEQGLPSADAVNMHLGAKPDAPGAPCPPVPDVPDHDTAMTTGSEAYAAGG